MQHAYPCTTGRSLLPKWAISCQVVPIKPLTALLLVVTILIPLLLNYSFCRVIAGVSMLSKAEIRRRKQQSARDKAKHREEQEERDRR